MDDESEDKTDRSVGMEKMISMMSKIDDILSTVGRWM